MKKNSFTLIELLAVIIVLGVILTIAIPKVMGAIDSSKKQSLIISAESLIKELNKTYINDSEIAFTGKNYFITNNSFTGDKLNITGELPDSGNLYINSDGKVALTITKGDYCVVKDFNDDKLLASSNFASCILNIPEPVPESCFTYTSTATEVTITGYSSSCSKNVIIPDTLGGLPVRILGSSSFRYSGLLSIKISSNVRIIQQNFADNNYLVNLEIPYGVKSIASYAFAGNKINNLTIPSSVTFIGGGAFNRNQIPEDEAFIYARNSDGSIDNTTLVSYGGTKKDNILIPINVKTLGVYSMNSLDLNSLTIPSTINTIGPFSLSQNNFTSITIPNSVTAIEQYSFLGNEITNLTIPSSVTIIKNHAFANNKITNLVIPNSVISIGSAAFNGNLLPDGQAFIYFRNPDGSDDLTTLISYGGAKKSNVIVPSTVNIIDDFALQSCDLLSVTIPSSVTSINYNGFAYNRDLSSITIPNSVINIGTEAFRDNALTNIVIPSNVNISNSAVSPTFYTTYVTNNASAAGTYTATSQSGTWTKQP